MKTIKFLTIGLLTLSLTSCYDFNREQAEKDAESKGKQILLEAESSKKAKIEESKANLESTRLDAERIEIEAKAKAKKKQIDSEASAKAKIELSKADAKAIENVANALKGNPEYLQYKQINALSKGKSVFVPTENNMPIILNK